MNHAVIDELMQAIREYEKGSETAKKAANQFLELFFSQRTTSIMHNDLALIAETLGFDGVATLMARLNGEWVQRRYDFAIALEWCEYNSIEGWQTCARMHYIVS